LDLCAEDFVIDFAGAEEREGVDAANFVEAPLGSFGFYFFVHRVMFNHPSHPLSTFSGQVQ